MDKILNKISAVIVCFNEENIIEKALKSIQWADEIIVVDSYSIDKTVEICKKYTDKVFQHKWEGHVNQKKYAISLAKNQWVLSIDSDEEVSVELKKEIIERANNNFNDVDGFMMKRKAFYLGKWIKHGGWYPDYKIRLFKKDKVNIVGMLPHDRFVVNGKIEKFQNDLLHYTYENIAHQINTIQSFSDISAKELFKKNVMFIKTKMIVKPIVKFFETFIYKAGFLDGVPGFIISILTSYYIFIKYSKLWEMKKLNK